MILLMNAAVIPTGGAGTYTYRLATWEDLAQVMSGPLTVRSAIGYPETAEVVERMTGYLPDLNRELVELAPGDTAWVVRLRFRVGDPRTKGARGGFGPEDYEVGVLSRER